jgi:transcriptional regulator with XRE-family HTH domain
MSNYDSPAELEIQAALRAHWKEKDGSLDRAAARLGWSQPTLSAILRGASWPSDAILADAGIDVTVTVTRVVTWSKSK